jgi:hypothetical protein
MRAAAPSRTAPLERTASPTRDAERESVADPAQRGWPPNPGRGAWPWWQMAFGWPVDNGHRR